MSQSQYVLYIRAHLYFEQECQFAVTNIKHPCFDYKIQNTAEGDSYRAATLKVTSNVAYKRGAWWQFR